VGEGLSLPSKVLAALLIASIPEKPGPGHLLSDFVALIAKVFVGDRANGGVFLFMARLAFHGFLLWVSVAITLNPPGGRVN
jgi:hypothetical protein